MTFDNSQNNNSELAYDLRQEYARIVGEHLQDIAQARKADAYNSYFKCLVDLYTIVCHKFKKPEADEKEYQELIAKAKILANQNISTWTGTDKNSIASAKIEESLQKIEIFLYRKMDEAKLFGSKMEDDGL